MTAVGAGAMKGLTWKTTTATCQRASIKIAAPTGSSRRRHAAERAAATNSSRAAWSLTKASLVSVWVSAGAVISTSPTRGADGS